MSGGDWKAMFKAVQDGDYELVSYYLQTGIDPNYQHPEFMALPLVESIRYRHIAITKQLLEAGADPSIKEVLEGETAFSVAKEQRNEAVLEVLEQYRK